MRSNLCHANGPCTHGAMPMDHAVTIHPIYIIVSNISLHGSQASLHCDLQALLYGMVDGVGSPPRVICRLHVLLLQSVLLLFESFSTGIAAMTQYIGIPPCGTGALSSLPDGALLYERGNKVWMSQA